VTVTTNAKGRATAFLKGGLRALRAAATSNGYVGAALRLTVRT